MVKEMEELRKDNDTLRSMIKVYQVNGVPSVNKVKDFFLTPLQSKQQQQQTLVHVTILRY